MTVNPINPTPIKLIPSMFVGHNKVALRAIFQKFATPGIIVADVELEIDTKNLTRTLVITYCRESEGKMRDQFNPAIPASNRIHEFPAHQLRVRTERGSMYLDSTILIAKFALVGGH